MIRLIALASLLLVQDQDPPPPKPDLLQQVQESCTKLMQQASYSFSVGMKVTCDDALKQVLDNFEQDVAGVYQKDAILHAKAEDLECVKNGGDALFLYQKKWRTREETTKLFKNKVESPTRLFDTMDNPHDEVGSMRERVNSLEEKEKETIDGVECRKLTGPLSDDGAGTLAKTFFGRLKMKGAGKKRDTAEPSNAKGTATVWLNADGLPLRVVYDLSFSVFVAKTEYKAALVRTLTVGSIGTAKLDVPVEVRKRLKIE